MNIISDRDSDLDSSLADPPLPHDQRVGTEKTKDKTKNNYTTPKIMTVSSFKECAAHIEQETN